MTYSPENNIKIYSRWCLHCVKVYSTEPLRTGLKDGGEKLTYFALSSATNYMETLRLAVNKICQSCSVLVFISFPFPYFTLSLFE